MSIGHGDNASDQTEIMASDRIEAGPPAPGTVLSGRYRLDSEIGRGGMGIVFRGTDLDLGRSVAIKILSVAGATSDARRALMREARAAASLNHPRIIAVHDVREDRSIPYFVMELVHGSTLRDFASREIADIIAIARQICEALEHAHANGIVHRDLKPENILLSSPGSNPSIKLADLGLAGAASGSDLARTGSIAGTVTYMAPEQALGRSVDARADLYSLGVLLYEMTTGRPPFTGDDPLAVVSQHIHAPVVPPRAIRADIPVALENVILRLLAKSPDDRYADARETAESLGRALEAPSAGGGDAGSIAILDALARGRLVGRAPELAEAHDLWRRVREGRGHGLLLSGEPGVGKTRLAREILVRAALDGAVALTAGCYEYEAATPYLPFVEAFRRWLREKTDTEELRSILQDAAVPLAALVPEIEGRLGPFPPRYELSAAEQRLLLFDAVAKLLRTLAGRRGLVFYIDDLHWADASTLWLLAHLLRQLREERVLILGSYRETELDRAHPLAKALVDWNRERLATRISIRRFGPDETRMQLTALLGEDLGGDFAGAVHRETEGNPFFVEEVLKALIEQGSVRRDGGRWVRSGIAELEIPQSMKAAIGNRLERVGSECNEVLRAAAVLGKSFAFDRLGMAAGDRSEDAVADALDEAVAAQLITAGPDETYVFTHDKIREVLYEEMNPVRRRRIHRRIAEGLESGRGRARVPVEMLAHHFIEAGDPERGLRYAQEAAAEAIRLFAYDEAIAAFGRALDCARTLDRAEDRIRIEESIGSAWMLKGDLIPASGHFEAALALATDPAARARLQVLAASSLVTNGDPRGLEHLSAALRFLDPDREPLETANALAMQGRFHHLAGQHRRAIDFLERAAALAVPGADSAPLSTDQARIASTIYAYLSGAYQHLGLFEDSGRWARLNIAFGEKHGLQLAVATGYEFLGENAAQTGDWEAGLEYAEREVAIADRIRSRERRAWSLFYGGICAMRLGRMRQAEETMREGAALAGEIGEKRLRPLILLHQAILFADEGRLDEALSIAEEAMDAAEVLDLLFIRTEARRALAHVRFRMGDAEGALRLLEEIPVLVGDADSVGSRVSAGLLQIEVLLSLGRTREARETRDDVDARIRQAQSPCWRDESARSLVRIEEAERSAPSNAARAATGS